MARYGMMIDLDKCVRCRTCYVICKVMHEIPTQFESGVGYTRIRLMEPEVGAYPEVKRHFVPFHCMQCDKPVCVEVCPVGASFVREDGIVTFDTQKCIGCEECVEACPYHARYINEDTGKVDGCNMCADRVDEGQTPWCVERCVGSAMIFGDLDDPQSEVSKAIKKHNAQQISPGFGTKPKIFYANLKLKKMPEGQQAA